MKELVPPNLLSRANGLAAPTMHATPLTPNFMLPGHTNKLSPESLSSWADTVAMILTTTPGTDTLATLTALGDQLLTNDWVAAAHVWYENFTLLAAAVLHSPATSFLRKTLPLALPVNRLPESRYSVGMCSRRISAETLIPST